MEQKLIKENEIYMFISISVYFIRERYNSVRYINFYKSGLHSFHNSKDK